MKRITLIGGMLVTITLLSCSNSSENKDNKVEDVKITASTNTQKLPDDFPTDIYLLAGNKENLTSAKIGEQKTVSFYQSTKSSSKEIRTEIVKNMEKNGWKTDMNVTSQLYFSKENNTVRIGIVKNDNNETGINYIITY